jgi:hypothetical protein
MPAVVEDVEPEVEQAARHGRAVDPDVPLDQVPPARAEIPFAEAKGLLLRVTQTIDA